MGLLLVAVAMVLLPLLYLALIAASAWLAFWWATNGLEMLFQGSVSAARIRLVAYGVPLVCLGAVPLFLIKPLFARGAKPPADVPLLRRDQPLLFAFVERLAMVVGAPVPDRIVVDTQVNAGAGLELGLLKREGSSLVMSIGLPLVSGLTLPQLASVLAHEFGHFGQGMGMRLGRVIRGVNFWFARVVYERDDWDEALENGRQSEGWESLVSWGAQLSVGLGRRVLYVLMMAGHGISCFLSRQMEFDADQYGARVAGSSVFADTSLRVRVLSASSDFVLGSLLAQGRFVDDVPALIASVADHASPRLMAEIRMEVQRSGTKLFDTHPSDLERLRRARAGRFPGLLKHGGPASALFRDYEGVCRRATLELYERSLGVHAPGADALLPVAAFVAPPEPPPDPKRRTIEFPRERLPRVAASALAAVGGPGDEAAARDRWRALAPSTAAAIQHYERAWSHWLDALQADALMAAGLAVPAEQFSLPAATREGAARTRARALAMQEKAEPELQAAEQALGVRIGLAVRRQPEDSEERRLLAALPALEAAQVAAAALRSPSIVLACLLANQKNRMGHAGLDQEIDRRLPALRRALAALRTAIEKAALPGWKWDVAPPWPDDPGSHVRSAEGLLEVLDVKHLEVLKGLQAVVEGPDAP